MSELPHEIKALQELGFDWGRMIAGSKSMYSHANPEHQIVFNANVIVSDRSGYRKIWYGDLDLDAEWEMQALPALAQKLGVVVSILKEMDARFDTENEPLVEKAVRTYAPS